MSDIRGDDGDRSHLAADPSRTAGHVGSDRCGNKDPSATLADVQRLAEIEEAAYSELEAGPCDRLTDPAPRESQVDWSAEIDAQAADYEAELEVAL